MKKKIEDTGMSESADDKTVGAHSMLFNILLLLVGFRAVVSFYMSVVELPHAGGYTSSSHLFYILFFSLGFVFALLYGLTLWGLVKERKFAFYLGSSILLLDLFFAMAGGVVYSLISLSASIVMLWLFVKYRNMLHKFDKKDKQILVVVSVFIILYIAALYITYQLPNSEEIYTSVVAEALIQKNPEKCLTLSKTGSIDQCILEVAVSSANPDFCKLSKTESHKTICLNEVTT